jgi:predicted ATP-grasp superfamily ATP-dependent carboligase
MRVLVFEHIAGGGVASGELAAELRGQGAAMLQAVAADMVAAGCEVQITRDRRVPLAVEGASVTPIDATDTPARVIDALLREVDAALIIAPETDGWLAHWTSLVEQAGVANLGSGRGAIERCADKAALASHLRACDVPTPAAYSEVTKCPSPAVAKPRDGAGGDRTYYLAEASSMRDAAWDDDTIFQPWVAGVAASASVIVRPEGVYPFHAGRQRIAIRDHGVHYCGGSLPLPAEQARRAMTLAARACRAVDGLHGFVGVDVVLSEAGSDQVIEINPRVTMSYLGLRALADQSLGRAILGEPLSIRWRGAGVAFDAAGAVTVSELV